MSKTPDKKSEKKLVSEGNELGWIKNVQHDRGRDFLTKPMDDKKAEKIAHDLLYKTPYTNKE